MNHTERGRKKKKSGRVGVYAKSWIKSGQRCPAVRGGTAFGEINSRGGTINTKASVLDYYEEQVAMKGKGRKSGKKGDRWLRNRMCPY